MRSLGLAGLPAASLVRTAEVATLEASDAQRLGRVSAGQMAVVRQYLASTLGAG